MTTWLAGMAVWPAGDYLEAMSPEPMVTLERRHTEVRPSIWFAALTGGMVGRIERFDHDVPRLAEDD